MLALTNTPYDEPVQFSPSGRALYTWRVMYCYLPHEIEPFWDEPTEYNPKDDWHPTAQLQRYWATYGSDCHPDPFTCWRRDYMNWHKAEECPLSEEKKLQGSSKPIESRKKWRKGSLKVMNKQRVQHAKDAEQQNSKQKQKAQHEVKEFFAMVQQKTKQAESRTEQRLINATTVYLKKLEREDKKKTKTKTQR